MTRLLTFEASLPPLAFRLSLTGASDKLGLARVGPSDNLRIADGAVIPFDVALEIEDAPGLQMAAMHLWQVREGRESCIYGGVMQARHLCFARGEKGTETSLCPPLSPHLPNLSSSFKPFKLF